MRTDSDRYHSFLERFWEKSACILPTAAWKRHELHYSIDPKAIIKDASRIFSSFNDVVKGGLKADEYGAIQYLVAAYLREVWISELNPENLTEGETIEIALRVVEGSSCPSPNLNSGEYNKIQSLYQGIQFLELDKPGKHGQTITMDLILKLHSTVGRSSITNAGCLRTSGAAAAGTSVEYLPHALILGRLSSLVKFVNSKLAAHEGFLSPSIVSLAALFFSEFLHIHPFSDGNGRTARLLTNFILKPFCVVPFSLSLSFSRENYLAALMEAQQNYNFRGLFLVSIDRCSRMLSYLLLDDAFEVVPERKSESQSMVPRLPHSTNPVVVVIFLLVCAKLEANLNK
ncbi:hypothetical protein EON65_43970 [archaeon]|nr:MAG: hypothetical protein EON65_43970 [archaeon]